MYKRAGLVRRVDGLDQLADQPGDNLSPWALVDHLACQVVADVHRPRPPASRVLRQVVTDHHEVEAADERLVEVEMRVFGELQDVRHRVAVSLQREARLGVGVERLFAGKHGGNVFQSRVVAFDRVRALHRTREGEAAQRADPAPGGADLQAERLSEAIDRVEDLSLALVEVRRREQHVGKFKTIRHHVN
jgi:hypothetical protein